MSRRRFSGWRLILKINGADNELVAKIVNNFTFVIVLQIVVILLG
jgi:hypothetical protein